MEPINTPEHFTDEPERIPSICDRHALFIHIADRVEDTKLGGIVDSNSRRTSRASVAEESVYMSPPGSFGPGDPSLMTPPWPPRTNPATISDPSASRYYHNYMPPTPSWIAPDGSLVSPNWPGALAPGTPWAHTNFVLQQYAPTPAVSIAEYPYSNPNRSPSHAPSTPSTLQTPVEDNKDHVPPKKRGRPYKTDLSTVKTYPRPGRPPKNPPINTATRRSPKTVNMPKSTPIEPDANEITPPSDTADDRTARNRKAAAKCRAKAQTAAALLEAEELSARISNRRLSICKQELQNEALALRDEILRHSNCGCPLINSYLAARAREIAGQDMSELSSTALSR